MAMLKCYQRTTLDIILGSTVFFLIKTTETSQNSQKSQNLVTLWFSRRFPEEIEKKNRFSGVSRRISNFQEFPKVWQPCFIHCFHYEITLTFLQSFLSHLLQCYPLNQINESNPEDKLVVAGILPTSPGIIIKGRYYPSSTTPLAQINSFLIIRTIFFILLVIRALCSFFKHCLYGNSSISPVLG